MSEELREQELVTLKAIAETLNQSNDLNQMLQSVLEELLSVTGLSTGWIFLAEDRPSFHCTADYNLPPALLINDKKPMCNGGCWCLDKYWDGRLKEAVNIIECKRLEDAAKYSWGDTKDITHHATVPLSAGGEKFGLLNVASPGKEHFSDEELTLLQSVAYQIGTAVKRTLLYQAQEKRAENYARLDELTRLIWKIDRCEEIGEEVVEQIGSIFHYPVVAFFRKEGQNLSLRAQYDDGKTSVFRKSYPAEKLNGISRAYLEQQIITSKRKSSYMADILPPYEASAAIPLTIREERIGVLLIGRRESEPFTKNETEVFKAIADHLTLAIESARLNEQRQELVISEERNRLARDLHDSVSQKLFSLSMTARGAKGIMTEENELLKGSLEDIQKLAQEALTEMRSLIWQLRPAGIEEGIVTSLKKYGNNLGLNVYEEVNGVHELPRAIEETIWRIGQEALNNAKKHSDSDTITLRLESNKASVSLEIEDQGNGFDYNPENTEKWSLGMTSMKERAELVGGCLTIRSAVGDGTKVKVTFPLNKNSVTK
ncbi:GAF domain-containing sensor histidine kinase [Pseudalkalibacillus caeni]|uniref:histidine kinase n=1 Tax=Exobacillus caeni TaxID=2574798 RepID=A0A5R9F7B3_9BACL|nr:GAF domain-containing sensor histidine kinase [Pseudalkalibacillus caeni]TLS38226.1 GAF domain-containing sensor histidine kinase [Pseudalkalibacillus caeni]